MLNFKSPYFTIHSSKPDSAYSFSKELNNLIDDLSFCKEQIVVLCIGTDRSTGDCLGPLVGYKLSKNYLLKDISIYGTLDDPVHAKNLEEKVNLISSSYDDPLIIAVDASLGKNENIGNLNLIDGPLFPGAGVNKNLKPVGDISITGIVNLSGFMEYIVLQNTRLSLVMQMADVISLSLYMSLKNYSNKRAVVY